MKTKTLAILFSLLWAACAYAADTQSITVSGRAVIEVSGDKERLLLHGSDGQMYVIEPAAVSGEIKSAAMKIGAMNSFTIEGTLGTQETTSCKRANETFQAPDGTKGVRSNVSCITYKHITAERILSHAASDQTLPPPITDQKAEQKFILNSLNAPKARPITGEIYARIVSVSKTGAIRTISIENTDTSSPIRSLTALITADTQLARKSAAGPEPLLPDQLKEGQSVTLVYEKSEKSTKALYITVNKE